MTSIPCKHALALARREFPVIPLAPGQKTPLGSLVPHGARDATIDPEVIRRWWCLSPSANIGVTLPLHLVIDRDDRNGGDVSLAALQTRYGPLPRTWGSLTAGGEHAWYALPDAADIRGGNSKLGPGLDIKTGVGAYVVAPPSLHPLGVRYEWRSDCHPCETPLAVAPAWMIELLTPPAPLPPRSWQPSTDDDARIAAALSRIPSDDRDAWIRVGMALRSHYGEAGRAIWDGWSATSQKYDPRAQERVWRSFRRGGINIGTIFHLARGASRAA